MTDLTCIKLPNGAFMPSDEASREAGRRFKIGRAVRFKATQQRNYEHHKKWWALVEFAYDHWEPPEIDDQRLKGIIPEKNLDRFRKDVTILAGFYDATFRLDGTTRIEAKSISFASMSQDDFDKLYDATFRVIWKKIFPHYAENDLHDVINQLLEFA